MTTNIEQKAVDFEQYLCVNRFTYAFSNENLNLQPNYTRKQRALGSYTGAPPNQGPATSTANLILIKKNLIK